MASKLSFNRGKSVAATRDNRISGAGKRTPSFCSEKLELPEEKGSARLRSLPKNTTPHLLFGGAALRRCDNPIVSSAASAAEDMLSARKRPCSQPLQSHRPLAKTWVALLTDLSATISAVSARANEDASPTVPARTRLGAVRCNKIPGNPAPEGWAMLAEQFGAVEDGSRASSPGGTIEFSRTIFSPGRPRRSPPLIRYQMSFVFWVAVCAFGLVPRAAANSNAPSWMHAQVGIALPAYDEKTDAVLLYSATDVTVLSAAKIRTHVREVYKILRPEGRERGTVAVSFNPDRKITSLHGWCIPVQGKDYEVKDKDAIDVAAPAEGGYLVLDTRYRLLRIPASDVGNIVGYEYEVEEQPFFLQDIWDFQGIDPVRESHYALQLPPGWVFKASWLFHPEVKPDEGSGDILQWAVSDVKEIRHEPDMPPLSGVAGKMIVSFFPAGGTSQKNEFANWADMGNWYENLISGRMATSEPIKQEVATLTVGKTALLAKMQAIAGFVQHDIRYVGIELGIGGFQPHAAPDVFSHRYGDCKDKATLMHTMLREIGVDSYHVLINTERGSITRETPAHSEFDHVILAIKLPDEVTDPSLIAVTKHPKLGRILFFDPTNELTPFGQIGGYLQANYGLLVTPEGGDLVELPQQPSAMNSIERVGKLTLDANGMLKGDVKEMRVGDRARSERGELRTITKSADRIKPIESLLAASLSSFQIESASLVNLDRTDQPFGFNYSFQSGNYAKLAGNLLLVRPRVLGSKSSGILETKEPRKFPLEFDGPSRDTDSFDITLPPGYEVDELPPPMDLEYSFGSYHSKTEASGQVLHYVRALEIKELSVPVSKMDELKQFYRMIASDERNTAVLKPTGAGK
jgi:transglutaminase-like putative cysteine protease